MRHAKITQSTACLVAQHLQLDGGETPLVHEQMKTPNTNPQAIKLNLRCPGQAHFKGSSTGPRNMDVLLECSVFHL